MNIVIIIPAYNEEAHIEKCLTSLVNQSYSAKHILVVDDGSTDKTPDILSSLCSTYENLTYASRGKSFSHEPGSKIVEAFNFGLSRLASSYDILCKFDADLIFPNHYLETLRKAFEANSKLGMFAGFCSIENNGVWQIEKLTNPDHIRGALKSYRQNCFRDIGGLTSAMGWDTIDEMKARYYRWEVETDNTLVVKHLKPTGLNYSKSLPIVFGISLFRMRYSFDLAFLTCFKMALNKNELNFFYKAMLAYLKSNSRKNSFLINEKEGNFIRKYRWRKIKQRLF